VLAEKINKRLLIGRTLLMPSFTTVEATFSTKSL